MALIDLPVSAQSNTLLFRANSAAEMLLRIQEAFVDNDGLFVLDVQLQATGAAPNFVCLLTIGVPDKSTEVPFLQISSASVPIVLGGQDTVDPVALAAALGEAIRTQGAGGVLYKAQVAGGGVGPHWMALALIEND